MLNFFYIQKIKKVKPRAFSNMWNGKQENFPKILSFSRKRNNGIDHESLKNKINYLLLYKGAVISDISVGFFHSNLRLILSFRHRFLLTLTFIYSFTSITIHNMSGVSMNVIDIIVKIFHVHLMFIRYYIFENDKGTPSWETVYQNPTLRIFDA